MLSKTRGTPLRSPAPGVIPDTITGPMSIGSPVTTDPDVGTMQASAATANGTETRAEHFRRKKAANGDIDVEHAHGSVSAKTANGHIRVGSIHCGSLVAETATGHIEVGIAGRIAAWLDLHTHYGHVHNGLDATEGPRSADEQVEVRARTGFGDITIRREAQRSDELHSGGRDHE